MEFSEQFPLCFTQNKTNECVALQFVNFITDKLHNVGNYHRKGTHVSLRNVFEVKEQGTFNAQASLNSPSAVILSFTFAPNSATYGISVYEEIRCKV